MNNNPLRSLIGVCKALRAENRSKMFELLYNISGQIKSSTIVSELGLSDAVVSKGLKELLEAGLVSRERSGRDAFWEITDLGKSIADTFYL